MSYRVTRNGYEVKFFDSIEEVEQYVFGILEIHKELRPKEIFRSYPHSEEGQQACKETIKSVWIFQYDTLYSEMFMIEERIY